MTPQIPTISKEEYERRIKGTVPIFEFQNKQCPRCGSGLVKTRACTGLVKKGWETMLRCPKVLCGHMEGFERKNGGQGK